MENNPLISIITSAYAKDTLQNYVDNNSILYINPNKKETNNWLTRTRLQLPFGVNSYGLIKEADFFTTTYSPNSEDNVTDSASIYTIAQMLSKVNPIDRNLLKYVPDEFIITDEQRKAKKRGLQEDAEKYGIKNQEADEETPVDIDFIQSLTEANKQLEKELGKAKVTNEKIIERAEKLAEKRKEKSKQKMADMRKLVKLQGTVNAYSRGSLDAIASQLVKYSGAENIDKLKLIDKLQNYYA